MKKIFKYKLIVQGVQTVIMPVGAKILYVDLQNGDVTMWALVDEDAPKVRRAVVMFGTGHDIPNNISERQYYGTVLLQSGALVFHIFVEDGGTLV